MKILIKTLAELQQFLKLDSTFIPSTLYPYQEEAIETYLLDLIGQDMLDALLEWYNDSSPDESMTTFAALLPYCQRVVAKFSFFLAAPTLDVKLTDSGFAVVSTQNLVPASRDRVNRFVSSLQEEGFKASEMLLRFLEKNSGDYSLWTGSDAYTLSLNNLVNSSAEFDHIVDIARSSLTFKKLRPVIEDVERLQIRPVISDALFDKILDELRNNQLSNPDKHLLYLLQRAVVNYVAASRFDLKYQLIGDHYLAEARKLMDRNPDNYPEYRDSIYIAEKSYQKFENSDDNAFFVAG